VTSPALQSALSAVNSTFGPIISTLGIISDALNIIKLYANPSTDPFAMLVSAAFDELEAVVNNAFGTGVYFLHVTPFNVYGNKNHDTSGMPILYPQQAIQAAISSFDDIGDQDRPQFSNSANVAAIGFMATATSVPDFTDLIEAMLKVFHIPEWELVATRAKRRVRPEVVHRSYQPDWKSMKLDSIGNMSQMHSMLLDLLETLRGYATIPDNNIGDLITAIQGKIAALNVILKNVKDTIAILTGSAGGIYVMDIPNGTGGNDRIKRALRDPFLEQCKPTSGYTIMTIMMGGGPSLATVEAIRSLML
jgi:hypothetical protein